MEWGKTLCWAEPSSSTSLEYDFCGGTALVDRLVARRTSLRFAVHMHASKA